MDLLTYLHAEDDQRWHLSFVPTARKYFLFAYCFQSIVEIMTNQIEHCSARSLLPIFTKMTTKAESHEMWWHDCFYLKSEIVMSIKPEMELL